MLKAEATASTAPEQDIAPDPNISEVPEELTARQGLQAERAVVGGDGCAPEIPGSHPEVNAKTVSVEGLIKACPYFAHMAKRNPELAKARATEVAQRAREYEAMRESGMSDAAAKKQQWAAMREQHKQRVKADEKQIESVSVHQDSATGRLVHEQQTYEAAPTSIPEKTATVFAAPEPQPGIAEAVSRTFIHEALEVGQTLEPIEQRPVIRQEQNEHVMTDTRDITAPDEWAVFEAEPVAGQEMVALMDEQAAIEPASHERIELITKATSVAVEIASDIEQIEPIGRADKLHKKSLQIYEDFIEALQPPVVLSIERPVLGPESELTIVDEDELADTEGIQIVEAAPDIAVTVAERLIELEPEDKEVAVTVVADIVQTAHLIEVLNTEEIIEPEAVETMQAELEKLTTTLFEQLGIEYEPEDIEGFIAVLFRSDFRTPQTEATKLMVDLERDGTHEAKYHFPQLFGGLTNDKDKTHDFLGKLILFHLVGGRPRSQMLAY